MMNATNAALLLAEAAINSAWKRACAATKRGERKKVRAMQEFFEQKDEAEKAQRRLLRPATFGALAVSEDVVSAEADQ